MKHNEKLCCTSHLGCQVQGEGHNWGSKVKFCLYNSLKPAEANVIKPHRKVNHNEKVCYTIFMIPNPRSRSQSGVRGQIMSRQLLRKEPKQTLKKDKA